MNRLQLAAALGGLALALPTAHAQEIKEREIRAHLELLSSDLLEGRAPATRGGTLTESYLASHLRYLGLEPANNGSYLQRVPIDVVAADRGSIRATASGRATATLRYPEDVVMWAGSSVEQSAARAPVVFVGYGVSAPEFHWDDFKNIDLRGKILLVLVNDPPAPRAEPDLFGGAAMTYYGRWTYKFEEAERRGAAGMLIIHNTERAGYGWATVVGSWAKEQRMLPRSPQLPAPLGVRGWITEERAGDLLRQAGLDLARLRRDAESRNFRPVETGITLDLGFTNTVQHLESHNVVGRIPGSDPEAAQEHILLTAHWDHLGIGPAVNGDSIYNGALDNASGTANLLALSHALAHGPKMQRSVLVAFVTAEESGLLGSAYLAENPIVPNDRIVANLNIDGGNVLGETRDLTVLGDTKSSLGPQIAALIRPRGMTISPDANPERGYFYRSDHFSFAKAGVPAVSIGEGDDFVGRPREWGKQQAEDYTTNRYHQPGDEYRPDWNLTGAVQLTTIVLELTRELANSRVWPSWEATAEFRRAPRM
ncbi:MAG: M28 family peptidase [Gemmatimonadaceae bacterium]|nr:M28 family peptidase [Gemmatimonadaceae bacterium]MCW5827619.1 M28 family peptidase [Gemmatimonadaceae bacterium]